MGNNPRILIVEDQNIVAMDIQNRLTNLNYIVTGVASSGAGAIKKAEETKPDLVLMDIMLKGDMDGIGAAQQIRTRLNIPIVYLTAYADANTLQRAKITEPFGYILKPFEERELHTTIEMAMYRHKMEKQLRESEQWFATTLKCIGEAVITTDKEWNITFVNAVAESLLHCNKDDIIDKNLNKVLAIIDENSKQPLNDYFVENILKEQGLVDNIILVSVEGKERFISKSMSAIRNDDNEIIGYVIIFKDITESIRINDEKNKNEKFESLSRLVYGVAKDLNNYITAISGNISLAKLKTDMNDKIYPFLGDAENIIFKANHFISDLFRFAKTEEPVKKVVSTRDLLDKLTKPILKSNPVNCELNIAKNLYNLDVDENQILKALENIITNIIKLNDSKDSIKITVENIESGENNQIISLKSGNYVDINLKYYNEAHKKNLYKIFEPYFLHDGLNMSIANSFIDKNNGMIKIESIDNYVSFSIYLPASTESNVVVKKMFDASDLRGTEKVIIMDDEPTLLDITENMLSDMGYEVDQARNGKELIEMYNKAFHSNEPYSIVVMDLTIPGGMGGKEAIKEILKIDPKAKVIICSGYSNDPTMSNFREYGFSEALVKPFRIKDLIHKIRDILDDNTKK